jgi:hypothetical protein
MNERIRELAAQADVWCDQNVAQGSPDYNNVWEHKFAELIIKACCQKLENDGMVEVAMEIKEHFGVET